MVKLENFQAISLKCYRVDFLVYLFSPYLFFKFVFIFCVLNSLRNSESIMWQAKFKLLKDKRVNKNSFFPLCNLQSGRGNRHRQIVTM